MFELADFLVGIYKVEDCTQSLTIKNTDKENMIGYSELKAPEEADVVENSMQIDEESPPLVNGHAKSDLFDSLMSQASNQPSTEKV